MFCCVRGACRSAPDQVLVRSVLVDSIVVCFCMSQFYNAPPSASCVPYTEPMNWSSAELILPMVEKRGLQQGGLETWEPLLFHACVRSCKN